MVLHLLEIQKASEQRSKNSDLSKSQNINIKINIKNQNQENTSSVQNQIAQRNQKKHEKH